MRKRGADPAAHVAPAEGGQTLARRERRQTQEDQGLRRGEADKRESNKADLVVSMTAERQVPRTVGGPSVVCVHVREHAVVVMLSSAGVPTDFGP